MEVLGTKVVEYDPVEVGMTVHFVSHAMKERPAIITKKWSETTVNLAVIPDAEDLNTTFQCVPSVPHNNQPHELSWHYIDECEIP